MPGAPSSAFPPPPEFSGQQIHSQSWKLHSHYACLVPRRTSKSILASLSRRPIVSTSFLAVLIPLGDFFWNAMQNINGHSQSHRINRSISIPAMVCDDLENPGSFTLPVLRMGVSFTKLRNAQRVPISSLTSSGNSSKSSEPTQESGFSPVLFLTESLNYPTSRIFSQPESSPLSLRNLFFLLPLRTPGQAAHPFGAGRSFPYRTSL